MYGPCDFSDGWAELLRSRGCSGNRELLRVFPNSSRLVAARRMLQEPGLKKAEIPGSNAFLSALRGAREGLHAQLLTSLSYVYAERTRTVLVEARAGYCGRIGQSPGAGCQISLREKNGSSVLASRCSRA